MFVFSKRDKEPKTLKIPQMGTSDPNRKMIQPEILHLLHWFNGTELENCCHLFIFMCLDIRRTEVDDSCIFSIDAPCWSLIDVLPVID